MLSIVSPESGLFFYYKKCDKYKNTSLLIQTEFESDLG